MARPTSFGARARLPNDASLTFGLFFTLSQPTLRVIPSERHTMIDTDLAAARIRSPFLAWAMLGGGAIQVILAVFLFALLRREPLTYLVTYLAWFLLVIGSALVVEALWLQRQNLPVSIHSSFTISMPICSLHRAIAVRTLVLAWGPIPRARCGRVPTLP